MADINTKLLKVYQELDRRIQSIDLRQGGPEGARGKTGPKGAKGAAGTKGLQGPKGTTGATGPQGPKGATGPKGSSGRAGGKGAQGPIGHQGPTGEKGSQGPTGRPGHDGIDGVSITDVQIDFDGHLTVSLSDGTEIDAGYIDNKAGDTIVYTGGSGGGSGGGGGTGEVPEHNLLDGLQGGGSNEYYHLSGTQYTDLVDLLNNGLPHKLFGPEQTDVDTSVPITHDQILRYTDVGTFVPDRRTKVHFVPTQPSDAVSLQGDMWAVTLS